MHEKSTPGDQIKSLEAKKILRFFHSLLLPFQRDVDKRLGCCGGGSDELKDHPFFTGYDWSQVCALKVVYKRVLRFYVEHSQPLCTNVIPSKRKQRKLHTANPPPIGRVETFGRSQVSGGSCDRFSRTEITWPSLRNGRGTIKD
jgi:hypothetical protein